MTIEELREKMAKAERIISDPTGFSTDWEAVHSNQDDLLIEFIDDLEVAAIFSRTTKWYA